MYARNDSDVTEMGSMSTGKHLDHTLTGFYSTVIVEIPPTNQSETGLEGNVPIAVDLNNSTSTKLDTSKVPNVQIASEEMQTDTQRTKIKDGSPHMPVRTAVAKEKKKRIKIAMYHFYHGGLRTHFNKVNMKTCYYYQNCDLVMHRQISNKPIDADAVLLQGNHMPAQLPKHKDSKQVFIFLTTESPQYLHFTHLTNAKFNRYLNWTMSYRLDSDIPYLYGMVLPKSHNKDEFLNKTERTGDFGNITVYGQYVRQVLKQQPEGIRGKDYDKIYREKHRTKQAVWLVSHCVTASKREQFVSGMQKMVNIDIFGGCTGTRSACPRSERSCDDRIVKKYKFYLAFENSLCTDYVTEKAFKWYNKDIILVVRGARKYSHYLPKGTYIDADDFETPQALGAYLERLANNKEEYSNMLKRKDKFTIVNPESLHQLAYCRLCYMLNNRQIYQKSIANPHAWWDVGTCRKPSIQVLNIPSAFHQKQ